MITVYYRKVLPYPEAGELPFYLGKLETRRREKLLHMKNKRAQAVSLAAGCVLYDALCERLGLWPGVTPPFSVEYGEKGKPFLPHYPELHFNLSHSGDYVCAALGDGPVGVDLQEKTEVRMRVAERFFTASDNQRLAECKEEGRRDLFFRMWSVKESYVKLTGEGMSRGLSDFEIDWAGSAIYAREKAEAFESAVRGGKEPERPKEGQRAALPAAYFREQENLPGYSFCVCFREPEQEVLWKALGQAV